jgi:hypothetical protein
LSAAGLQRLAADAAAGVAEGLISAGSAHAESPLPDAAGVGYQQLMGLLVPLQVLKQRLWVWQMHGQAAHQHLWLLLHGSLTGLL